MIQLLLTSRQEDNAKVMEELSVLEATEDGIIKLLQTIMGILDVETRCRLSETVKGAS